MSPKVAICLSFHLEEDYVKAQSDIEQAVNHILEVTDVFSHNFYEKVCPETLQKATPRKICEINDNSRQKTKPKKIT